LFHGTVNGGQGRKWPDLRIGGPDIRTKYHIWYICLRKEGRAMMVPSVETSSYLLSMLQILKPAIIIAGMFIPIPICFKLFRFFKEQLVENYYIPPSPPRLNPEPEENIIYSDRDNGYWVKMPDGSKTLVEMSEIYPNDASAYKVNKITGKREFK
jgi:hypothetical protein